MYYALHGRSWYYSKFRIFWVVPRISKGILNHYEVMSFKNPTSLCLNSFQNRNLCSNPDYYIALFYPNEKLLSIWGSLKNDSTTKTCKVHKHNSARNRLNMIMRSESKFLCYRAVYIRTNSLSRWRTLSRVFLRNAPSMHLVSRVTHAIRRSGVTFVVSLTRKGAKSIPISIYQISN